MAAVASSLNTFDMQMVINHSQELARNNQMLERITFMQMKIRSQWLHPNPKENNLVTKHHY